MLEHGEKSKTERLNIFLSSIRNQLCSADPPPPRQGEAALQVGCRELGEAKDEK